MTFPFFAYFDKRKRNFASFFIIPKHIKNPQYITSGTKTSFRCSQQRLPGSTRNGFLGYPRQVYWSQSLHESFFQLYLI